MVGSGNGQLLRTTWDAVSHGDFDCLARRLAPDAKWRAIDDGPWNCDSREAVLDVVGSQLADGLRGRIEETFEFDERVLVAFRPYEDAPLVRPLDDGIAYLVVTVRGGVISEIKGCPDRLSALTYASGGALPPREPERGLEPLTPCLQDRCSTS